MSEKLSGRLVSKGVNPYLVGQDEMSDPTPETLRSLTRDFRDMDRLVPDEYETLDGHADAWEADRKMLEIAVQANSNLRVLMEVSGAVLDSPDLLRQRLNNVDRAIDACGFRGVLDAWLDADREEQDE